MNVAKSSVKMLGGDKKDVISDIQLFREHSELTDRLTKTLYYGELPSTDRPSLPLTGITLEFFSKAVPKESLDVLDIHYAASVSRRACMTPCSMMLAIVYLEQLRHQNPEYLQTVSSCDIFLVSMLVASKFLYDEGEEDEVFSDEWAASANMELHDLNKLERDFLTAIDWELFVKPETFLSLLEEIEVRIALNESSKRGWLSYTDISVLMHKLTVAHCWSLLVDGIIKVVVASTLAYTAAVFTLVGAAALVQQGWVPYASHFLLCTVYSTFSGTAISKTSVNRTLLPEPGHSGLLVSSPDLTLDVPLSEIPTVAVEVNLQAILSVGKDFRQQVLTKVHAPSNASVLTSFTHSRETLLYHKGKSKVRHSLSPIDFSSLCHVSGYCATLCVISRLGNRFNTLSGNCNTDLLPAGCRHDNSLCSHNTLREAYTFSPSSLPPCVGLMSKV